jgi:glycosyltransferase involved in cell wall biosynthesis
MPTFTMSAIKKLKTIVVLPAYNAEATLEMTIAEIPFDYVDELILVDDRSEDRTVELAGVIGATHPQLRLARTKGGAKTGGKLFTIVEHDRNKGYGGNQKKCYELALAHGADIVVMLHPDYQYDPKLVKYFVEFIRDGYFDVVLGSRIRSRREALEGGMPVYKYIANRLLSAWQNIVSGRNLSEWHTGMRAYRKEVLQELNFDDFSDDFIFDTQMLFAIVARGFSIGDIPVPVRYRKDSSSINLGRSIVYGALTLLESFKFLLRRVTGSGAEQTKDRREGVR